MESRAGTHWLSIFDEWCPLIIVSFKENTKQDLLSSCANVFKGMYTGISFGLYNTKEEIDTIFNEINKCVKGTLWKI